ncbi:MAG: hypothetical protein ABIF12_01485 [bacterium]
MKNNKMLKLIFILVIIFNCCKINFVLSQNSFSLRGYIQANQNWKKIPEFRILFNGKQVVSDENGFYSFPIENKINKFHFLICKNVEQNFEKINTVKNLSLKFEKPYKYYSFTKTGTGNVWIKKEKDLSNKNFTIHKNSVIALINPDYIEKIEPWMLNLDPKFLNLPKIVFKDSLEEKVVQRGSAKSLLYSLDSTVFHKKVTYNEKNFANNVKATITQ